MTWGGRGNNPPLDTELGDPFKVPEIFGDTRTPYGLDIIQALAVTYGQTWPVRHKVETGWPIG
jgi:hypothetical protein